MGIQGLRRYTVLAAFNLLLLVPALAQVSDIEHILTTVSADSLLESVRVLSGVEPAVTPDSTYWIRSRWYGDNDAALHFIRYRLESYGYTTVVEPFDRGVNVHATRQGLTTPDRFVIICAHYDAVSGTPGADDNASGTAAVLEAARVMAQVSTGKSIVFALWDTEEIGLVGSAYYAQQAADADMQIEAVVNLDMIGWDGDGDGVVEIHANPLSAALAAAMSTYAQTYTDGVTPVVYESGLSASDHASFWRNGYPAVLLIEEYFGGDFNRFYHQPSDSVGNFNTAFFVQAASLGIAGIAELADVVSISTDLFADEPDPATLLLTAYPVPVRSTATVEYQLPSASEARISAFDVMGRRVAVLVDGFRTAGHHQHTWSVGSLSPGLYVLRLEAENAARVLPLVLID